MRNDLEQMIAALESASNNWDMVSFAEFENILGKIGAVNDPACIRPLVLLFEDDASLDELMFSIVHTIEMFDDRVYVEAIFNSLPELARRSPRWAKILHMRILNSDPARLAYRNRFLHATLDERAAARTVLDGVRKWRPEFTDRVNAVLQ